MKILNGKELADEIKEEVRIEVERMKQTGQEVCLAVIRVGDDQASSVYVNNKVKSCEYCGIKSERHFIDKNTPVYFLEKTLINLIEYLNKNNEINGILVQLPLPDGVDENKIINAISPDKDVDGFHESNVGKLMIGEDTFIPCTTKGIIELLERNNIEIEGKNCVVVGRSNIVGKPTAIELLHHNGTVTVCHSKTKNLKDICKQADILVCAIGKPKFFNKEYIKEGAVVVDVGIHRIENGLCGDVDFDDVKDIVSAITPVPGGVGKVTVAMLMKNCVKAAKMQYEQIR